MSVWYRLTVYLSAWRQIGTYVRDVPLGGYTEYEGHSYVG